MDAAQRRRGADDSGQRVLVREHLRHRLDEARRRAAAFLARALPARLVAGPGLAAHPVARVHLPRAPGGRVDRAAIARRRGVGRCRHLDRGVTDPGPVRDLRPAAHAALRLADVVDAARAQASERGDRRLWIAAGAVLGLSVFVHPTAPLYAGTALIAALLFAPRDPRSVLREAWPGLAAFALTFGPYYVRTLHVLGDRYGVSSGAASGRTFSGRPVWEDARRFIAPGRTTSTTSPSSPRRARCAARRAPLSRRRLLCADRRCTDRLLLGRACIGRLRAVLRPLHDPRHPGVPRARHGRCRHACPLATLVRFADRLRLLVIAVLVGWLLGHELHYDLRHRDHTRAIGDRGGRGRRGPAAGRARCSSARRARAGRCSRRSTTAIRRTCSTGTSR